MTLQGDRDPDSLPRQRQRSAAKRRQEVDDVLCRDGGGVQFVGPFPCRLINPVV